MKLFPIIINFFLVLLITCNSSIAEVVYIDTDAQGTPVAMWDINGKKVWEGEYFPFGEEYNITQTPKQNDIRFIGKEKDSETGLHYFGARYYDESSGRFLSPDPVKVVDPFTSKTNYKMLENPQMLNRYTYGLNNPYRFIDPDGREVREDSDHDGVPDDVDRDDADDINSFHLSPRDEDGVITLDFLPVPSRASKAVSPNTLQQTNINRFIKKVPANAKENVQMQALPNSGIAVQATSPGNVPGSKAVYEKQINAEGTTTQYTKTTYDPQGNIVHVKDKIPR